MKAKSFWSSLAKNIIFQLRIFTVRKRSLGQGNVFICVCHSVHRVGGGRRGSLYDVISCLAAWSHIPSWDLFLWSHVSLGLSVSRHTFLLGSLLGGGSLRDPPGQRRHLDRDPQYSKERAVRILLECILVLKYHFCRIIND